MRCKVLSVQEISSAGIHQAPRKSKEDICASHCNQHVDPIAVLLAMLFCAFAKMIFKLKKVCVCVYIYTYIYLEILLIIVYQQHQTGEPFLFCYLNYL